MLTHQLELERVSLPNVLFQEFLFELLKRSLKGLQTLSGLNVREGGVDDVNDVFDHIIWELFGETIKALAEPLQVVLGKVHFGMLE